MTFDGMLTLLSILVLLVELTGQVSVSGALSIYEDGAVVSVFPRDVFSEADCNLTFQVSIDNVANLYGLDVQLSWNPTVIQYLGHHKMIPVEAHPGGVPYSPTIPVENDVDETASMVGAEPGTRYWLAETSMLPAPLFVGHGTFFTITFRALRHGDPKLIISGLTLSDMSGCPPLVTVENGNVGIKSVGDGDVNDDGIVDVLDLAQAAGCYCAVEGQPGWNQFADLAPPWKLVEILDLVTISSHYGKRYY